MSKAFSFTITPELLLKGLRPQKRMPKDKGFLVECVGAVGRDSTLQIIDELTRMNTSAITDGFPFPQIFVFTNLVIVCGRTKIYEWVNNSLVEKLTVSAGSTWNAVDFFEYVYMSNGKVAVVRDVGLLAYTVTTALPIASTICNYSGQVMVGAPGGGVINDEVFVASGGGIGGGTALFEYT